MTKAQMEVLKAIVRLSIDGVRPSVREVTKDLGYTSTNGTQGKIQALVVLGYLKPLNKKARSLRLTARGNALLRVVHCPECGQEIR